MKLSSDDDDSKRYKPNKEFIEYSTEPLVDLNLNDSTELWLIKVPNSNVSFFLFYTFHFRFFRVAAYSTSIFLVAAYSMSALVVISTYV